MRTLPVEPLERSRFAAFGDVIETAGAESFAINAGSTERFHALARARWAYPEDSILINLFRSQPAVLPITLTLLERHPLGSQAFIPLCNTPFLVVVAPDGGPGVPDPDRIRVFLAQAGQGVNYHPGTWHHPVLALDQVSDFIVIDREGEGHNCDEFPLGEGFRIDAL